MAWKQARERQLRLKKRSRVPKYAFLSGVWYDEDKGRFVQEWISERRVRLRKVSNRKVRRANRDYARETGHADRRAAGSHGAYRKIFDYQWELD